MRKSISVCDFLMYKEEYHCLFYINLTNIFTEFYKAKIE